MGDSLELLKVPFFAALVMAPLHGALGLHVIRRGVIFIDLAVAQIAALGISVAMARGVEPDSPTVYWAAVISALLAALVISLTRYRLGKIPHEAMIGIIFVLGSAGSIVVLQYAEHGQELIKTMLDGQILFVQTGDVAKTALVYALIAVVAVVFWKRFSARSEEKDEQEDMRGTFLDFVFYALIAVMVASSVQIAGVLVVFTWLVMPAVIAWSWAAKFSSALWICIPLSVIGSLGGMVLSLNADSNLGGWPTGASIVLFFGGLVLVNYLVRCFINTKSV